MNNTNHGLYNLSESIDWVSLEKEIAHLIGDKYQSLWRLVSGSIYLKSFYGLSTTDLIARWSVCPYHRFFCTGKTTAENHEDFPVPIDVLERLSLELAGEGYDAMINALTTNTYGDMLGSEISSTLH